MRHPVFVLLCLCLWAPAAQAQFVAQPTTSGTADCTSPALASAPDGTATLAYVSSDELLMSFVHVQTFMTTATDDLTPPDTVLLNSGSSPVVCWSHTGYHVAFVSADMILIYHSTGFGTWDLANFTMLATNGYVRGLEILGIPWGYDEPDVYLAVHTFIPGPDETHRIQFASCTGNVWTQLESLDMEPQMTNPQLALYTGSYTPTPQLFYQGGDDYYDLHLKSTVLTPSNGWTEPTLVMNQAGIPSPIVGEFDVATCYYTGDVNILGLGAQPTCPCGSIYLHSYVSVVGTWNVHELTAPYSFYDWPMSPRIAACPEENMSHAFWFQRATGEDFVPYRKTLEYRTIENGDWIDAGDFLDEPGRGGPLGERVAITVDDQNHPVLAWTRRDTIDGQPQREKVWMARHFNLSAAPEADLNKPLLALSAWPNPFNPQVNISFEIDQPRTVRLDVFDARGRRVANLLDRVVEAGHSEISWNARNDAGRRVPSGVYFARLVSGNENSVLKLVLAE